MNSFEEVVHANTNPEFRPRKKKTVFGVVNVAIPPTNETQL